MSMFLTSANMAGSPCGWQQLYLLTRVNLGSSDILPDAADARWAAAGGGEVCSRLSRKCWLGCMNMQMY